MEQTKKIKANKMKGKFSLLNLFAGILLAVYSITIIYVLYFVLTVPFKTQDSIENNFFAFPLSDFNFDAVSAIFKYEFNRNGYIQYIVPDILLNTVLFVVGGALLAVIVPCIMAYAASKFDYWFSKVIYALVVIVMSLPIVGNLPSMIKVLDLMNLYDTVFAGWVMKANFVNMYFLVFYAIFVNVPKDYTEAAYIDGASEFRVMTQVMLPLVKTTFFTVFIVQFVHIWNDYQTPLMYFANVPPIAWAVYQITMVDTNYTNVDIASCLITVLPSIVLFICFRKSLMGNLTMGGIKG